MTSCNDPACLQENRNWHSTSVRLSCPLGLYLESRNVREPVVPAHPISEKVWYALSGSITLAKKLTRAEGEAASWKPSVGLGAMEVLQRASRRYLGWREWKTKYRLAGMR